MSKQNIIYGIVLIILIVISVFYFMNRKNAPVEVVPASVPETAIQVGTNEPVVPVPDLSPSGRVNPMKEIKVNPFD